MKTKAVYPGSFDPPTYGHLDIIKRASVLFDEVTVLIALNRSKQHLLSVEERAELLHILLAGEKNISVDVCGALVVDYMHEHNISVLIRGVRTIHDFTFEYDMARWNQTLAADTETVLLLPHPEYAHISSTAVRELFSFKKDITSIVPPPVSRLLAAKTAGSADTPKV
ncbi:MAG: pantetheine-phosphate adenylyltransferase [Spirochaetaceae bacterium]|jgi:pantetheine-phosphate adenylyltransferase|nr:pantetheine-phosphate adenylyltransferase [Spirochaetaceae bacterium]